jgi:hypothetical protein
LAELLPKPEVTGLLALMLLLDEAGVLPARRQFG